MAKPIELTLLLSCVLSNKKGGRGEREKKIAMRCTRTSTRVFSSLSLSLWLPKGLFPRLILDCYKTTAAAATAIGDWSISGLYKAGGPIPFNLTSTILV